MKYVLLVCSVLFMLVSCSDATDKRQSEFTTSENSIELNIDHQLLLISAPINSTVAVSKVYDKYNEPYFDTVIKNTLPQGSIANVHTYCTSDLLYILDPTNYSNIYSFKDGALQTYLSLPFETGDFLIIGSFIYYIHENSVYAYNMVDKTNDSIFSTSEKIKSISTFNNILYIFTTDENIHSMTLNEYDPLNGTVSPLTIDFSNISIPYSNFSSTIIHSCKSDTSFFFAFDKNIYCVTNNKCSLFYKLNYEICRPCKLLFDKQTNSIFISYVGNGYMQYYLNHIINVDASTGSVIKEYY